MAPISKRFERRPIGRQIKRDINGEKEPGVVSGMYSMAGPEWRTIYAVTWKPTNEPHYEEHLALKSVQQFYKPDDSYADEPYVDEEIRLLQKYGWDERKCPKKGTPEFDKDVREKLGTGSEDTGKSGSRSGRGKKATAKQSTAAAVAKGACQVVDAVTTKAPAAKKQKSDQNAAPAKLTRMSAPIRHIAEAVNGTADKIKEVGQMISDALPSSSTKQSSGRPAVSTGTIATAQPLTGAAQKAQQAIAAMAPARGSGTGKRASSGKEQEVPPTKRASRHATAAAPTSAVVLDDKDEDVDIDGDAPHAQKAEGSSGLLGRIAKAAATLSAAPRSQAHTSDHQGGEFEATGLQQGEEAGAGAGSSAEAGAGPQEEEEEEMVELGAIAEPPSIPRRMMMCQGDVPVAVYNDEDYEETAEYVVDCIVSQKGRGKALQYMVKWKGYEIDPAAWTPRGNLKDTTALDNWEKALKANSPATKSAVKGKKRKSGQ